MVWGPNTQRGTVSGRGGTFGKSKGAWVEQGSETTPESDVSRMLGLFRVTALGRKTSEGKIKNKTIS